MKNSIIALIVVFLLWLFFGKDKTTKTVKAPLLVGAQGQSTPGGAIPTGGGGTVTKPAAQAIIPNEFISAIPADYKVNPITTYTPPPEIAAVIQEKKAEILANPYRPEALAAEAELQKIEAQRQSANEALRMIEQKIAQAEAEKKAINEQTIAAQQAVAAKAKAENEAKAIDLAFKAANSGQLMQLDAGNSEELKRLNAFLAVKNQVLNSAIYDTQRLTILAYIHNIEANYKLAYERRLRGESQDSIDNATMVAQLLESTLKLEMASTENYYLSMQAIQVNKIITAQPDFVATPLVVEPKPFTAVPVVVEPAPAPAAQVPAYVAPAITEQAPAVATALEPSPYAAPTPQDYIQTITPEINTETGALDYVAASATLGRRGSFLIEM